MNIAVYGDSYAVRGGKQDWTWFRRLKDLTKCSALDHYGESGSSLFFSYNKFLESHADHDIIIFIVTGPGRYTKKFEINQQAFNVAGLTTINGLMKEYKEELRFRPDKRSELESIKHWFIARDDVYEEHLHNLLVDKIMQIRPDVKLIPAFSKSLVDCKQALFDYTVKQREISLANVPESKHCLYRENPELMSCHLTQEQNIALADMAYNQINAGILDWSFMDNVKCDPSKEYYIRCNNE